MLREESGEAPVHRETKEGFPEEVTFELSVDYMKNLAGMGHEHSRRGKRG